MISHDAIPSDCAFYYYRKIRTKHMRNKAGATSKMAEKCYSKCVDMSEVRTAYIGTETKEVENEEEE